MSRLVDKLNTPTTVVITLVLAVSVNGLLYLYHPRDPEQEEPPVEEVQVLPRAQASSDTPNGKDPDQPMEPSPKKKLANKDNDKERPQPKRDQDTERNEDRPEKDEDAHSNSPSPKVASSSHKKPSSAVPSSGESIEEVPPVEASALPAAPSQEPSPVAISPATAPASVPPATAPPATAPPATTTDTDASQDYSGTAQGSPADGGGAGLIPAVPPTQDVSPAPQVGVN